ncbi:helix-turn-helix transcriptional regulator [Escherichia coli]|uniref:helix-turn-helix transcriptional regulator n=2 Tax=Escherichia coli TaxID=562 RepID=UPI0012FFB3D8|nr:helix-turn-helix transcriptional regulator [Escherichia coli]EFL4104415.1 helix-turn-helix transcriptional regulator [Escherichia coli]EFM0028524.1 helix-turn-helix transcriptional regulator [Escherichia coli]EHD2895873.1 helix-turn-helix transcriptional regulator [Escherichia coli]EHH8102660.1 helix-turn-helix transcriptional regulator [Escherichia coli]EHH8687052.1 helix-turn-helix transcriptional regulator [Escherichia coli]
MNSNVEKKTLTITNIKIKKHFIIYTSNCELLIETNGNLNHYKQNTFVSIEKGVSINCTINKINQRKKPCEFIVLDRDQLIALKDVCFCLDMINIDINSFSLSTNNKVIEFNSNAESIQLFRSISTENDTKKNALKLATFIANSERSTVLIQSILSSGIIRFSDKLIKILDQDLSKRWRLGDIAEIFNVSEVSIRKRLDAEQTTFYQILYERKMNKALQLLLDNELQVDMIAKKIGISSTSYFIKSFKKHFGVTPKSFLMYFR